MQQVIMKKVKWFHGVTTYISNTKITITPDPFDNTELDTTAPEYIIISSDKGYNVLQWHNATDYVKSNILGIDNLNSIYDCYKLLWDGFKTIKDAKGYIQELELEEVNN